MTTSDPIRRARAVAPGILAAAACAIAAVASGTGTAWERIEAALDAGDPRAAESLFTAAAASAPGSAHRHRREISAARLAASRGDWRRTDAVLRAWRNDPARGEGSGDVLFWQGWSALHQGRTAEADSLLVLAGAYPDEPRAQEALEYRFAALLENSPALLDYLRGLPESPLPEPLRAASLQAVRTESRLHPHAQWHLALLLEGRGDTSASREILGTLSRASSLPGRRAAALLAFLREEAHPDSALAGYERLLLKQQQGILAEFSRKRTRFLRKSPEN